MTTDRKKLRELAEKFGDGCGMDASLVYEQAETLASAIPELLDLAERLEALLREAVSALDREGVYDGSELEAKVAEYFYGAKP
jgi:hypothetical protein